jgi:hypothetical protein
VDPFTPEFRRLLKEAHPGLRDIDIDRLQELSARRFLVPPEERTDQPSLSVTAGRSEIVRIIDREIAALKEARMPNFDRVAREYGAMQHAQSAIAEPPKVTIRPKR